MPRKRTTSKPSSCSPGTRPAERKPFCHFGGTLLISHEGKSISVEVSAKRDERSSPWHVIWNDTYVKPSTFGLANILLNGAGVASEAFARDSMRPLDEPSLLPSPSMISDARQLGRWLKKASRSTKSPRSSGTRTSRPRTKSTRASAQSTSRKR